MIVDTKRIDIIVAIDPDVITSGVCIYNKRKGEIKVSAYSFPKLLDVADEIVTECKDRGLSYLFVVEAGWLNKSNWNLTKHDTIRSAAAKGNSVGRNHETGRKIVECLEYRGINVEELRPLRKVWAKGKISHEELKKLVDSKNIRNLPTRTSQDIRDATLIAITR